MVGSYLPLFSPEFADVAANVSDLFGESNVTMFSSQAKGFIR
jgi:hypothetical protein